jgi:hypothetical protein
MAKKPPSISRVFFIRGDKIMAMIELIDGIENDPNQRTAVAFFASLTLWQNTHQYVTATPANNTLEIAQDALFVFASGRMFRNINAPITIGVNNLDQGSMFEPDTRYFVYLSTLAAMSITKQETPPQNALFVATFTTLANGYIDAGSVYDSQMMQRADIAMPVGSSYVQYPGFATPATLFPGTEWVEISFSGAFFRAKGGLASSYDSGLQPSSIPNLVGNIRTSYMSSSTSPQPLELFGGLDGVFSRQATSSGNRSVGDSGVFPVITDFLSSLAQFNAADGHADYGRRAENAPANYTVVIWRRIGTVVRSMRFAVLDDDDAYTGQTELGFDEAGLIDTAPGHHVEMLPSAAQASGSKRAARPGETATKLQFNRETGQYQEVQDHRGKIAYGAGNSRTIFALGDGLQEGESWDAPPEPTLETQADPQTETEG